MLLTTVFEKGFRWCTSTKPGLAVLIGTGIFGSFLILRWFYAQMEVTEYRYPRGVELTAPLAKDGTAVCLTLVHHEKDLPPEFPGFLLEAVGHRFAVTPETSFADWECFAGLLDGEYQVKTSLSADGRMLKMIRNFMPETSPKEEWTILYRNGLLRRIDIPLGMNGHIRIGRDKNAMYSAPLSSRELGGIFAGGYETWDGKSFVCSPTAAISVEGEWKTPVALLASHANPGESLPAFPICIKVGDAELKIDKDTTLSQWIEFCGRANIRGYRISKASIVHHGGPVGFDAGFRNGKMCWYLVWPSKGMKIRIGTPDAPWHTAPFSQEEFEKEFVSPPRKSRSVRF